MLFGSYITTKSNIQCHHLRPNHHVCNPLRSSAFAQEQVFNLASAPSNLASFTNQLFLYSLFVAIRLATNLPQLVNLPAVVVGISRVNVGNK